MIKSITCLLFIITCSQSIAATYVLEGENYNSTIGMNYSENMRLTGFIEFVEELEASATYTTGDIVNYRFNDGIQTMDQTDSEISMGTISTDANGLPFFYSFTLTRTPVTNIVGEPVSRITLYFGFNTEGFERSEGGFTAPCLLAGSSACMALDSFSELGAFRNLGLGGAPVPNWVFLGSSSTQSVPVNSVWVLFLMSAFMLLFAFFKHKKLRK